MRPRAGRWVVGLTGGIGSGKSAVLSIFRRAGVPAADSDVIVREAMAPGGAAYRRTVRLLGREVVRPDGRLDRERIAARVFRVPRLRRRLERLLHPLVQKAIRRRTERVRGVFVADVPLLFEAGWRRFFDETVVVWCPRAERLRRLFREGRFDRADVLRRMRAQIPLERKRALADTVIDNGGSRRETTRQVRRLIKGWREQTRIS